MSHVSLLRELKDAIRDLPVYTQLLSYFIGIESQFGLLNVRENRGLF
jgi:hypothetical protein